MKQFCLHNSRPATEGDTSWGYGVVCLEFQLDQQRDYGNSLLQINRPRYHKYSETVHRQYQETRISVPFIRVPYRVLGPTYYYKPLIITNLIASTCDICNK